MVSILLIVSQKFYRDPMKGARYGFYWNYQSRPYWSMLAYDYRLMLLRERLLVRLEEPAYSFAFIEPDTLIVAGERACYLYIVSEEGTAIEKGRIQECNRKTWVIYLPFIFNIETKVITPRGNRVYVYTVKGLRVEKDTVIRYDYPTVSCWFESDVVCALDTGVYRGATDVSLLDKDENVTLITYPWGIRVMRGKDTVVSLRTPSKPLDYSYSHGLLHVALGSYGILTVDIHTGAHTYYRDISAVAIYSSLGKFVVLVEDVEGCIHVFRPVFRPPSVKYVRKGETTFCREASH